MSPPWLIILGKQVIRYYNLMLKNVFIICVRTYKTSLLEFSNTVHRHYGMLCNNICTCGQWNENYLTNINNG